MRIGDILADIELEDIADYGCRTAATAAVFYTLEGAISNRYELNWFGHLMVFGTSLMIGNVIADSSKKVTKERYDRFNG